MGRRRRKDYSVLTLEEKRRGAKGWVNPQSKMEYTNPKTLSIGLYVDNEQPKQKNAAAHYGSTAYSKYLDEWG